MIRKTESLCNICLAKIPAETFQKGNRVYLKKNCQEHGEMTSLHFWDDPEIYSFFVKLNVLPTKSAQAILNITSSCNLTCPVCYAKANEGKSHDLEINEVAGLQKFRTVFISGGEPTLREDLPQIIKKITKKKCRVVIFSNGIKLADFSYAKKLKEAGLGSVILQFDTLDDKINLFMRGEKLLKIKKQAIKNLEKLGIRITTSAVLLRGKNFEQLEELLTFLFGNPAIKTIGLNPLKELGRYEKGNFVSSAEIVSQVNKLLRIEKSDWIASTRFLVDMDNLVSVIKKRDRVFSRCRLKCLFFIKGNTCVPLSNIFNLKKIHLKIKKIAQTKSKWRVLWFALYFLTNEILLNFFRNKNFKAYVLLFIKNFWKGNNKKIFILNPLKSFSVSVYPTEKNFDFDFIKGCNFNVYREEDKTYRPACLTRITSYLKKR